MTQEIAVKKQTPLQEIRQTMESPEMREQIKMALPAHISVEKFTRVVTTALANDPKLLAADRRTLYNSCMKCAADGLIPDGKEAALVPKGETVVYMPMISGVLKKIRNSGELSSINSLIVYSKEKFRLWVDNDGEHFEHEPLVFGDKGEPIGVYAQAKTKDGGQYFEIMSKEEVMKVRAVAATKAIWDGPFGLEKWKVACIRRLSKRLPMSTDLEEFQKQFDDEVDLDNPENDKPEQQAVAPMNTSSRLNTAVAAKATPPIQPKPVATKPPVTVPAEPNEAPLTEAEEQELPI